MFLFFDTETTGLPKKWNVSPADVDNWPRMVQLAWIICDTKGEIVRERNAIIRPEGYDISADVVKIHGITTDIALREGEELQEILNEFSLEIDGADLLVGHNVSFDECIVGAEFERKRMMTSLFLKPRFCTMNSAVNFCKLPGKKGYKAPRLSELHRILFNEDFEGAHNAMADVRATARCFWEMRKRNIF